MTTVFEENCKKTINTLELFHKEASLSLIMASEIIIEAFQNNQKLLICGNGGSAADSQHIAAEFVSGFGKKIKRSGLPAISLNTDTSILTAYANDFGYENVFSRQVEALGREDDVLLVISTSGNSKSCVRAVEQGYKSGMKVIALLGLGGEIAALVDLAIRVPSTDTQIIQHCHIVAYHTLVQIVETTLFGV